MRSKTIGVGIAAMAALNCMAFAAGEIHKEFRFTVGQKANITITNAYGPIVVRPASGNQVIVSAVLHSDKVEIDQSQRGSRIAVLSHVLDGGNADASRVDFDVQVPSDASVTLHSSNGPLKAERINGDVTLEGATAPVEVHDISDAHVHIKTMDGSVSLANIKNGHIEVTSVNGDVTMNAVDGTLVEVNSESGKIHYNGDFGEGGQYRLMSHTGDIEAFAPASASIDVTARSIHGQVDNDFTLEPEHQTFISRAGSAFAGTINKAASSVKLHSFSGKIHLKKRSTNQ